jgi:tRNA modification GTPase
MKDGAVQVVRLTFEGRGAVAVLLVEGPEAAERIDRHFFGHSPERRVAGAGGAAEAPVSPPSGASLRSSPGHPRSRPLNRLLHGHWGSPAGEDVVVCRLSDTAVEVHCHGGRVAVDRIASDLLEAGCQSASWRNWLTDQEPSAIRADARSLLAQARTERTAAILLDQYAGALEAALARIIDTVETGRAAEARAELQTLLARSSVGLHLVEPWRVVLAGPPNVGKSSLINALVGYRRSIVFDQPGTTRDVVTVTTAIDGWPIELSDTAGLRVSDDPLESAGVELARRQLKAADCIVFVSDATNARLLSEIGVQALACTRLPEGWTQTGVPGAVIEVYNKCDLLPPDAAAGLASAERTSLLLTSAVTGEGIPELAAAIVRRLVGIAPQPGDAVPFAKSQIERTQHAIDAIDRGDSPWVRTLLEPLLR